MNNLDFYYQEFINQTSHYKKTPGFNRTYKKMFDITGSKNETIKLLILHGYDIITIKYRISDIQYEKNRYQKKLNTATKNRESI